MKYSTSVSSSQAATAVVKMLRLESGSNKRDYHDRQRGAAVGTAKGREEEKRLRGFRSVNQFEWLLFD